MEFTQEQIVLLKKVGLTPEKVEAMFVKKEKKRRNFKGIIACEEYTLAVRNTCRLCGMVSPILFHMKREVCEDGQPLLHSTPVESADPALPVQCESRHSLTCKHCRERLAEWDVEDLITELIRARARM